MYEAFFSSTSSPAFDVKAQTLDNLMASSCIHGFNWHYMMTYVEDLLNFLTLLNLN